MGDEGVDQLLGEIDELLCSTESNSPRVSSTSRTDCDVGLQPVERWSVDNADPGEVDSANLGDEWGSSFNCSDFLSPTPHPASLKGPQHRTPDNQAVCRSLVLPSPFSPMPHYESMPIERLKACLRMYGLRDNMSKKRMLDVLEKIYNETHQYETDPENEATGSPSSSSPKVPPRSTQIPRTQLSLIEGPAPRRRIALHSRQEVGNLSTSSSSPDEEEEEPVDEAELMSDASEPAAPGSDYPEALLTMFRENEGLRRRMLMYEPIPHKLLVAATKDLGLKIRPQELSDWCFDKGIVLSFENNKRRKITEKKTKEGKRAKKTLILPTPSSPTST